MLARLSSDTCLNAFGAHLSLGTSDRDCFIFLGFSKKFIFNHFTHKVAIFQQAINFPRNDEHQFWMEKNEILFWIGAWVEKGGDKNNSTWSKLSQMIYNKNMERNVS